MGNRTSTKIFGIGLSKTGTTSLRKAMQILGFITRGNLSRINDICKMEFANDIFVAARFQFLDYCFTGSKFILTTRNVDEWLMSLKKHYARKKVGYSKEKLHVLENRFILYKCMLFDEKMLRKSYYKFHEKVFLHFKGRENDLLIMNIIKGDGWEKLCPFIGKEIPDISFPHENKTEYRSISFLL